MKIRRADKRSAPEVQADAHVDDWLAHYVAPARIKQPRGPKLPQHDAHLGAWRMEQLIEAQILRFTRENILAAFKKLHATRPSVKDSEIFHHLTKDFWPRVRYFGADPISARLYREFQPRVMAVWSSNPHEPGIGIMESKFEGKWVVGSYPSGKYRTAKHGKYIR